MHVDAVDVTEQAKKVGVEMPVWVSPHLYYSLIVPTVADAVKRGQTEEGRLRDLLIALDRTSVGHQGAEMPLLVGFIENGRKRFVRLKALLHKDGAGRPFVFITQERSKDDGKTEIHNPPIGG